MKISKVILSTIVLTSIASTAFAGSTSKDTTITLTAAQGCSITNSPALNISYTGLADATGSFDLQLTCDNGVAYTITVGDGQNPDTANGVRRASDGSGHFLTYRLYSDVAMTQELGVGVNNTITGTGDGTAQTVTIYSAVKTADNTSSTKGTYTDTINIVVSW